ncbi:MAG: hypothetical protein E6H81_13220 [Chloroflexi bacterium]|nr:MAG: hypothetical protein E6H81_13220 [Chloroflexota bacterium]
MLEFLLHLLKGKLLLAGGANIPIIATLLVLGTTGFVVTGTIEVNGDDDDRRTVNLVIKPLENATCVQALIAQTETLLELDALASDATRQLRHLRDRAREQADDQNKTIDETALRAQFDTSAAKVTPALAGARNQVLGAADLSKCRDGDPNTTVAVNLTRLQATYDSILTGFGVTVSGILTEAQTAFDQLVATAPAKPPKNKEKDDDEDDDDDD